jgi:hypothetical protein
MIRHTWQVNGPGIDCSQPDPTVPGAPCRSDVLPPPPPLIWLPSLPLSQNRRLQQCAEGGGGPGLQQTRQVAPGAPMVRMYASTRGLPPSVGSMCSGQRREAPCSLGRPPSGEQCMGSASRISDLVNGWMEPSALRWNRSTGRRQQGVAAELRHRLHALRHLQSVSYEACIHSSSTHISMLTSTYSLVRVCLPAMPPQSADQPMPTGSRRHCCPACAH